MAKKTNSKPSRGDSKGNASDRSSDKNNKVQPDTGSATRPKTKSGDKK